MELRFKIKSHLVNILSPYLTNKPEIVLLGDSNTLISYFGLNSDKKWPSIISKTLGMKVGNFAKDGKATYEFLNSKRLKKAIRKNAKYYIICFGLNDEKMRSIEQFEEDTRQLINEIKTKTNGLPILMTNLKVDYSGGYYRYDRNTEKIVPYDDIKRKIAKEENIHLIDVYSRFEREIENGNWDHRIRTVYVFDNSRDHLHQKGTKWFSNIHYNAEGNRIVAEEINEFMRKHLL